MKKKESFPFPWKHVHFVGKMNLDLENPVLYRYESFSRFERMKNQDKITFISPLVWPDLFEQRFFSKVFLNKFFGKSGADYQNRFFALCFTLDGTENADAMWSVRAKEDDGDFCIRYSVNLWRFLGELERNADKNGIDFYLSSIAYDYTQEQLLSNLHIESAKKGLCGSVRNFLNILRFKRRNFKYENEVRIWAVRNNALNVDKPTLLELDMDWMALNLQILVAPYKSDIKWNGNLIEHNRQKRNSARKIMENQKSRILALGIPKDNVRLSGLYDVPLWKYSKKGSLNLIKE